MSTESGGDIPLLPTAEPAAGATVLTVRAVQQGERRGGSVEFVKGVRVTPGERLGES